MTDRELDALVAERVMGFGPPEESRPWEGLDEPPRVRTVYRSKDGKAHEGGWATSGDGMLAVVEEMRKKGYGYRCGSPSSHGSNRVLGHRVVFYEPNSVDASIDWIGAEFSEALPMAVCLAALRAVGA